MAGGNPQDLRDLVGELFRSRKKQPHLVVTLLRHHWAGIVGAEMARKTWPKRLTKGTLWVAAADSGWAYQLQFMKEKLLASLAAFLERPEVTDLRFRVEPIGEPDLPPASPPTIPGGDDSPHPDIERAATSIADDRLRQTFVRALSRQTRKRKHPTAAPATDAPEVK